ncbi:MAG: SusC/RagA family TonB-linked outer membrane protein [Chitinophagaceae bacterium]
MKLIVVVCVLACLQPAMKLHAQTITLAARNTALASVFKDIRKQTGYDFIYDEALLEKAHNITITLKNASLTDALNACFADQPIDYEITGTTITIKLRDPIISNTGYQSAVITLTGKVTGPDGLPLSGASIRIKGTSRGTNTNDNGEFVIKEVEATTTLEVSYIGHIPQIIKITHQTQVSVCLKPEPRSMDEVITTGYRTTTRKLMLATVSKITAKEIDDQPVNNVLAAMQGRIPGMLITQSSGVPGSGYVVQIRGQHSIGISPGKLPDNSPLYIVDGVPFLTSSETLSQLQGSSFTPGTPFSTLNPADIESVEVLRDANSTSIYGSMGANGVVVITTKKPVAGKTAVDINMYMGEGRITRMSDYMNTTQYLAMREEALSNDGEIPQGSDPSQPGYAPDIRSWDTTRYTNWKKELIGGAAHVSNATIRLSGGSAHTQFALSVGYNRETTVFPGDFHKSLASVITSFHHSSGNNKFNISFTSGYTSDKNYLPSRDLTSAIATAPNAPVRDASGHLVFRENDIPYFNPFAFALQPYNALMERISGSVNTSYKILPSLSFKTTAGYTIISLEETWKVPIASQDPANLPSPTGAANFGNAKDRLWIVEPQLEFITPNPGSKNKFKALLGSTFREEKTRHEFTKASGYLTDASLNSMQGAALLIAKSDFQQYRVSSVYAVANYNYENKYLFETTGRIDGSSRFGPDKRLGKFGSVAAGWIFSSEKFMQRTSKWLSFGKIRTTYGTSGNDQIGNYQYLDTWIDINTGGYQIPGLRPSRLFNADLQWEQQRSIDIGLELGFFHNRIITNTTWNRSRSGNQLLAYTLPTQTGFPSILKNTDAVVQNRNIEIEMTTKNIETKSFKWSTSFNLSIQRNKLLKFPGLDSTPYHINYFIGQPLNLARGYRTTGIDPATGIYRLLDSSGAVTNVLNENADFIPVGTYDPKFFGGMLNSIQYRSWQLDFLFQFVKQMGKHSLYSQALAPGYYFTNIPVGFLNRWQKPGDVALYEKYTQNPGSDASIAATYHASSSAAYTDASFIRLKNISLSYNLPDKWMNDAGFRSCRVYLQAQNLLTITDFKGPDPENFTLNPQALPPIRMIVFGVQAGF